MTGLSPNTTYDFQIVATNANGTSDGGNLSFTTLTAPSATTNAATSVSTTTAVLNGSVNPNGSATTYYFQYGLTTAYGSTTTPASAGSGTAALPETANLTGLIPNTTYDFQIVATNANGTTDGVNMSFATANPRETPSAATDAACISATTAALNGSVDPNGSATTYYFQYGTTTAYGTNTTSLSAGAGTSALAESANLTGLIANTTYDFQLVATNANGTTYGGNLSFTTLPTASPSSSRVVATPS